MKRIILFICFSTLIVFGIYSQIDLQNGLVAYFPLDSNATDYSDFGIHGNIYGATSDFGKNNIPNTAFSFDGNNQYIDCSADQREITDKVSISVWIKKSIVNETIEHIAGKYLGQEGTIQQGFFLAIAPDGCPSFAGRLGEYYSIHAVENNIIDNNWHNLLGTIDNNEWNFWVDGIHIGSLTSTSLNPSLVCSEILSIGNYAEQGIFNINGSIDEVRIYNRILNTEEISLLSDIEFMHIINVFNNSRVEIYPNPTNDIINIDFGEEILFGTIDLCNVSGIVFSSIPIKNKQNLTIDIQKLPVGIYLILIKYNGQLLFVERIIKN